MLRAGLLAQTPVGDLIPPSLRELIRSQLGRLTPSAWTLLVAGATLGQGLTFERLIQVAQLDEQEGLRALEELLRNGLLCEGTVAEEAQAFDGYAFPREMIRELVYQEAGVTHQRLMQRRVSAVMREEAEYDQDEEVRLPHPTPIYGLASAETRNGQGRPIMAGAVSRGTRGMRWADTSAVGTGLKGYPQGAPLRQASLRPLRVTRRHADAAGIGEKTPLAAWERGVAAQAALAFPRPPPGSPARAFFETR